jgi:hypothetical protein
MEIMARSVTDCLVTAGLTSSAAIQVSSRLGWRSPAVAFRKLAQTL